MISRFCHSRFETRYYSIGLAAWKSLIIGSNTMYEAELNIFFCFPHFAFTLSGTFLKYWSNPKIWLASRSTRMTSLLCTALKPASSSLLKASMKGFQTCSLISFCNDPFWACASWKEPMQMRRAVIRGSYCYFFHFADQESLPQTKNYPKGFFSFLKDPLYSWALIQRFF